MIKSDLKKIIDKVLNEICEDLDIDNPNLIFKNANFFATQTTKACSYIKENKIFIRNDLSIKNYNDLYDLIFLLAHECRHIYQWVKINDFEPSENKETVETWRKTLKIIMIHQKWI